MSPEARSLIKWPGVNSRTSAEQMPRFEALVEFESLGASF